MNAERRTEVKCYQVRRPAFRVNQFPDITHGFGLKFTADTPLFGVSYGHE
jgi:hypothetical protein